MSETKPPFLKRVQIENFKSIRHCDVELQPLTLLVGPNGSGKTSFLDALRLVRQSLKEPGSELIHDFRGRWLDLFRREVAAHPRTEIDFGKAAGFVHISFDLNLASGCSARYSIKLQPADVFRVSSEVCEVADASSSKVAFFRVQAGKVVETSIDHAPPVPDDRPYLTIASAFPEFRPVYDALRAMAFHDIVPAREVASYLRTDAPLRDDGENVRPVFWQILQDRPQVKKRIDDYLRAILPSLRETRLETLNEMYVRCNPGGSAEPIENPPQTVYMYFLFGNGSDHPLALMADSMSDGTLHALGVLVALFQCRDLPAKSSIPLVAIEEPEANLHPGAAEVLMDAMTEASTFTQVLATTHSPDFLDYSRLDPNSLLVFDASSGETVVAGVDDASRAAIRDKLYSAGELLRLEQLKPKTLEPKPR